MSANYYGQPYTPPKKPQAGPDPYAQAAVATAPGGEAPTSRPGGNGNNGGVPDGSGDGPYTTPDPFTGGDPDFPGEVPTVPSNKPNAPWQWGTGGLGGNFDPGGTNSGSGEGYQSATGGLVGYYGQKMNSTGLWPAEYNALNQSTILPIQQQQKQTEDEMLRVRAATGNDAGIYGGLSEVSRNAGAQIADQGRKNVMANGEVARQEQAAGAAGNLNLYGQTQAETMEYLRMLGNLLGRQRGGTSSGETSGYNAGVSVGYSPGM